MRKYKVNAYSERGYNEALSNFIDSNGRGNQWAGEEFVKTVNRSKFEGYTMLGYIKRHALIDNGFELHEQDENKIVFKFTDGFGSVSFIVVTK